MEASPRAWAWAPSREASRQSAPQEPRKESEGGRVSAQFMLPRALLSPPSKTCAGPRKGVSGDRSVSGTRTQRGSRGTVEGACVPHTCVAHMSHAHVAGQLSHRAREIFSKFLCSKATTPVNIDSQAQLADDILSAPHPDMFKEQQLQVTVHLAFPQGVLARAGGPGGRGSCGGRSRLTHQAWVSGPGRWAEGPVGPWDASRPLHGPPQTAHPVTCAHAFAGTHRLAVGTQVYLEFFRF